MDKSKEPKVKKRPRHSKLKPYERSKDKRYDEGDEE